MKYFACFYPGIDFKYFWWYLVSPWWPIVKLSHADSGFSNGYPDPLPLVPPWAMLVWCKILGYGSTVAEDLSSLVCDFVSCGRMVPDVSKDCSAFIIRVKQSKKCGTVGSTHPTAQVPSWKTWIFSVNVIMKVKLWYMGEHKLWCMLGYRYMCVCVCGGSEWCHKYLNHASRFLLRCWHECYTSHCQSWQVITTCNIFIHCKDPDVTN